MATAEVREARKIMGGLEDPEKELGMNDSVQENMMTVAVRVCMLTQHTDPAAGL